MNNRHLPTTSSLRAAVECGADAATYRFDWEHVTDALHKVREECDELAEAIEAGERDHVVEELGDLLFAVCNVARKLAVDPDVALTQATRKFEQRFQLMLGMIAEAGATPRELTLDEMEQYWVRAKRES